MDLYTSPRLCGKRSPANPVFPYNSSPPRRGNIIVNLFCTVSSLATWFFLELSNQNSTQYSKLGLTNNYSCNMLPQLFYSLPCPMKASMPNACFTNHLHVSSLSGTCGTRYLCSTTRWTFPFTVQVLHWFNLPKCNVAHGWVKFRLSFLGSSRYCST